MANQKRKFDYEEVRQAARDTPDLIDFGARLGLGTETVNYFLDNDEQFAGAHAGGIEERNRIDKKYLPQDFYRYGKEKLSNGEIAEFYKTSVIRISQVLKNPEIKAAFEKGKAGLEFDDDFSTASILAAGSCKDYKTDLNGRDLSQNSKLGQLRARIFEAVRLGNKTLDEIARFGGDDKVSVYNALGHLVTEGKLGKRNGSYGETAEYFLSETETAAAKKNVEKPIAEPDPKPSKKSGEMTPRELILKAIDDGHHLSRAIIAATALDGIQVADELDDMEGFEITMRYAGNTRCYFRIIDDPADPRWHDPASRLVLDGMGGVKIIPPAPKKLEPSAHALEMLKRPPVPKTDIQPEKQAEDGNAQELENEFEPEFKPPVMPEKNKKNEGEIMQETNDEKTPGREKQESPKPVAPGAKKGVAYSEDMFEKFGYEGLNKSAIAERLGVTSSAIYQQLSKQKFCDAYERGSTRREEKSGRQPEAPSGILPSENFPLEESPIASGNEMPPEEAAPEAHAEQGNDVENLTETVTVDPRFAHTYEHLKNSERSRDSDEKVESEMREKSIVRTVPVLQEAAASRMTEIEKRDPQIRNSENYETLKSQFAESSKVVLVGVDAGFGRAAAAPMMQSIAFKTGNLDVVADGVNIFELTDREFSFFGEMRNLIKKFQEGTDEEKAAD